MPRRPAKPAVRAIENPAPRAGERRQALKVRLIEAAERAVSVKGLAGLNARELAREIGCSLGAIYNLVPDLDAIAYEVNSLTLSAFERFVAERMTVPSADAGSQAAVDYLVDLALAYFDFAVANHPRWRALFEHRIAPPAVRPDWYLADQGRLFLLVEKPLAGLRPDLGPERRALMARTMFSAVHGIVTLSLEEKLVSLPVTVLADQLRAFVTLLGEALAAKRAAAPARRRSGSR